MYCGARWLVEGRVAYWDHVGDVPITAIADANEIFVTQFLRTVTAPPYVHVIIDVTENTGRPPFDIEQLKRATTFLKEPTMGWAVFISDDMVKRFFATVVSQFARVRFRSVKTFEEACEFLNQMDATLPDLSSLPRPVHVMEN